MSSPPNPAHVRADIDPENAPETAANIREHVAEYGAETMTTGAKEPHRTLSSSELDGDGIFAPKPQSRRRSYY